MSNTLIEWTKLNKKLKELQEEKIKKSKRLEADSDKTVLLRPEFERLQEELNELVLKLRPPIQKEIKLLEKRKIKELKELAKLKRPTVKFEMAPKKEVLMKKNVIIKKWELLNEKLKKIKDDQEKLLKKVGLIKKWNYLERRRIRKQKEFSKKLSEIKSPIMQEIGELLVKKDMILSGKEIGYLFEYEGKIRELKQRYSDAWEKQLEALEQYINKLVGAQRILLREKKILNKWDILEKDRKIVEGEISELNPEYQRERKRVEIEYQRERKRVEIEYQRERKNIEKNIKATNKKILELKEKDRNILQKDEKCKKLKTIVDKIKSGLDRINEKRKRLIWPIDLEIVKIKQKFKKMEKNPKIKRWIKLNKEKIPSLRLNKTKLNIPRIGVYTPEELAKALINQKNVSKAPYYVNWRLTGACNSRCIMCDQWRKKEYSKQQFKINEINRILKELKRIGAFYICFNGGEPSLLRELPQIVKKAKDLGFFTEIKTNASKLTERYITQLYEAGLDIVHISLDGYDAKTHNKIRRMSVWVKAVKAMEFIKENTEMQVILNTLILKNNYRQLDKMIDIAKEFNVDTINFSQVDDLSFKNNKDVRLNLKQMKYFYFKVVPKILEKSIDSDLNVTFTPFFSSLVDYGKKTVMNRLKKNRSVFEKEMENFARGDFGKVFYTKYDCYTPLTNVEIMPDGGVYPCCTTMNIQQFNMGNVHDMKLGKIWNSEKFEKFRENVVNSNEEICKKCKLDFDINREINKILNKK
jgi:radical SAM protein with 4Fe4S-binding SPASM domain